MEVLFCRTQGLLQQRVAEKGVGLVREAQCALAELVGLLVVRVEAQGDAPRALPQVFGAGQVQVPPLERVAHKQGAIVVSNFALAGEDVAAQQAELAPCVTFAVPRLLVRRPVLEEAPKLREEPQHRAAIALQRDATVLKRAFILHEEELQEARPHCSHCPTNANHNAGP